MARVFIDGFEHGSVNLWEYNSAPYYNYVVAASGQGMDGNYCARVYNGASLGKAISPTKAELFVSFWAKGLGWGMYGRIWFFYDQSLNLLGCVARNMTSGRFEFWKGWDTTLLGTGTTVWDGSLVKLEIHFKPHTTNGIAELKVNGITEISVSGVSTAPSDQPIGYFIVGYAASNNTGCYLDNVIMDDAEFPGVGSRIIAQLPSMNGSLNEWTPSAGSNYQCVDEVPPSPTDTVATTAIDKTDLYGHAGLPGTVYQVKSVQVQASCVLEGAVVPTKVKPAVRVSGTTYLGTAQSVGAVYRQIASVWQLNPATSAAWLVSEVNAMEFGVKSAA